jgi:hypothetical protein
MRTINPKHFNGYINKECAFCGKPFFAKSDKAKYCSDSHKVLFSQMVKKSHKWYCINPNEGKILPPGTVTSAEMSEENLIFIGCLYSLFEELIKYLSPVQFQTEKEYILNIPPFSSTKDWAMSANQIFTDDNNIEVFRITPTTYKLYLESWETDDENPLK